MSRPCPEPRRSTDREEYLAICFEVSVNGGPALVAGAEDAAVLSAILSYVANPAGELEFTVGALVASSDDPPEPAFAPTNGSSATPTMSRIPCSIPNNCAALLKTFITIRYVRQPPTSSTGSFAAA